MRDMTDDNEKNTNENFKELDNAVSRLLEHYDDVIIFVQKKEKDGNTKNLHVRRGNIFSLYGQIMQWLKYVEDSDFESKE